MAEDKSPDDPCSLVLVNMDVVGLPRKNDDDGIVVDDGIGRNKT